MSLTPSLDSLGSPPLSPSSAFGSAYVHHPLNDFTVATPEDIWTTDASTLFGAMPAIADPAGELIGLYPGDDLFSYGSFGGFGDGLLGPLSIDPQYLAKEPKDMAVVPPSSMLARSSSLLSGYTSSASTSAGEMLFGASPSSASPSSSRRRKRGPLLTKRWEKYCEKHGFDPLNPPEDVLKRQEEEQQRNTSAQRATRARKASVSDDMTKRLNALESEINRLSISLAKSEDANKKLRERNGQLEAYFLSTIQKATA